MEKWYFDRARNIENITVKNMNITEATLRYFSGPRAIEPVVI